MLMLYFMFYYCNDIINGHFVYYGVNLRVYLKMVKVIGSSTFKLFFKKWHSV